MYVKSSYFSRLACSINPRGVTAMWVSLILSSWAMQSDVILCLFSKPYAVVTPLRKAASYEPRIAILGIWSDTWVTRGKYGIYVVERGSYGALTESTWRLGEKVQNVQNQPYLLSCLPRGGNEDTLVSAA